MAESRDDRGLSRRVKYGIPGIAVTTTISAGMTAYWCRDALAAAIMVLVLTVVAGVTTAIIVSDDF